MIVLDGILCIRLFSFQSKQSGYRLGSSSVPTYYSQPYKDRIQVTCPKGSYFFRSGNGITKLHRFMIRHKHCGLCDRLGFPVDEHLAAFDLVSEFQTFRCGEHTALEIEQHAPQSIFLLLGRLSGQSCFCFRSRYNRIRSALADSSAIL